MAPKKPVMGASQIICILVLLALIVFVFDFSLCKDQCLLLYPPSTPQDIKDEGGKNEFYTSLLRRLVKGENQAMLNRCGIACEGKSFPVSCVTNIPVSINSKMDRVHLHHSNCSPPVETTIKVWPYPWHAAPLKSITPINIYTTNVAPPPCKHSHHAPVVVFSVGGHPGNLDGNQFHEFNEIIIPLFITSRLFRSRVHFMITDYKPSFVEKYFKILLGLTRYPILSPAQITSVNCFPGAVIGLKFHTFLGLNSSDDPLGYSMLHFKDFLRETYSLKLRNVDEISGKPVLILIGRERTRKLVNEDEMVKMMKELGFSVIVARARQMGNLDIFSKTLGSCSVLVGVHGAGLANQVFLPDGALVVQLVPLGLDWASTVYFGDSTKDMGLRYLEYKIDPKESTLFETYGPDDPVINDPDSFFAKGFDVGRAIYLQEQNIKVNISRFKERFIEALKGQGSWPFNSIN